MSTTTTETTLFSGTRRSIHHITGIQTDGVAETTVQKVGISTLTGPDGINAPSSVTAEAIEWSVDGFAAVNLLWDRTSDVTIALLKGAGELNWVPIGGKHDSGSGGTGDILITTLGANTNDTYDITLYLRHEV